MIRPMGRAGTMFPSTSLLTVGMLCMLAGQVRAGDDPPEGPPWVTSYRAAQVRALASKTPIFVYFTKTY